MCANKKIQDISMKAAIGNYQILGLPIVSQRPLCRLLSYEYYVGKFGWWAAYPLALRHALRRISRHNFR
jgi:hypothetical protein